MLYKGRLLAKCEWRDCHEEICAAFKKFRSKHKKAVSPMGRKFFIFFQGSPYPPKEIRSIIEGRPTKAFSGGAETSELFRNLGFVVAQKKALEKYRAKVKRPVRTPEIRGLSGLLTKLFRQKWASLENEVSGGRLSKYPGVYLLAYTEKRLSGKRVEIEDIFYVGMSTTALRTRVKQFRDGIRNYSHSAAMRFYRIWAGNRSFDRLGKNPNKFYVATLPVECEAQKGLRTRFDLEKLGVVTALEYLALAKIKQKLDLEPALNKK